MKLKYYLRGLGIGIILTTLILTISFSGKKVSDEEVIKRAEELGMVMKEEESLFPSGGLSEFIQQTEQTENTESTEKINNTENIVVEENVSDQETSDDIYKLVIPAGTVPRIICEELEKNGIIESASEFRQYLVDVGYATSIVAGEYDIPYGISYEEIYQILKAGPK